MNKVSKADTIKMLRLNFLEKELASIHTLIYFIISSVFATPALAEFTSILSFDEIVEALFILNSTFAIENSHELLNPLVILFSVMVYTLAGFLYIYGILIILPKRNKLNKEIKKYKVLREIPFFEKDSVIIIIECLFVLPLLYTTWLMYNNKYMDHFENRLLFPVMFCDFKNNIILKEEYNLKIVQVDNRIYKCTRTWNAKMYDYKTYFLDKDNKFVELPFLSEFSKY
ncbi:hypothetical protein [Halarcobacter sp.]|uniref:hypothetical protein n=1 Tax=Halarcobacter sp. TaxID=2321133 RepID=UPI002AABEDC2|nr:hypothetical protein [Halarcobacter sp.]